MQSTEKKIDEMKEELKWIRVKEESEKTGWERTTSKTLSNPLVPIGVVVTTVVLGMGIFNLYKGDRRKQQLMMRYRVLAQGLTLTAAMVGMFFAGSFK